MESTLKREGIRTKIITGKKNRKKEEDKERWREHKKGKAVPVTSREGP
jgi:hypothetical protein